VHQNWWCLVKVTILNPAHLDFSGWYFDTAIFGAILLYRGAYQFVIYAVRDARSDKVTKARSIIEAFVCDETGQCTG